MIAHLVTFSDESMSRSADLCVTSANSHGVTAEPWHWTRHGLEETVFYRDNKKLLNSPRGRGYWAWKPHIIADTMNCLRQDDILIYADAGVEFINNVSHIIERMDQDIFLFGNNWEHAHWCKRDIVEMIWPDRHVFPITDIVRTEEELADYDLRSPWFNFRKQCQASVIFFRVSDHSRNFVAEWLKWCLFEGGRLIDDSPSRAPNHPEFQENRHDQAILTTLAYREGLRMHYWPSVYNRGGSPEFVYEKLSEYASDDYPILFNHHRRRNHEWGDAA